MLAAKGYTVVAKTSKKGMKPEAPADFSEQVAVVQKGSRIAVGLKNKRAEKLFA